MVMNSYRINVQILHVYECNNKSIFRMGYMEYTELQFRSRSRNPSFKFMKNTDLNNIKHEVENMENRV